MKNANKVMNMSSHFSFVLQFWFSNMGSLGLIAFDQAEILPSYNLEQSAEFSCWSCVILNKLNEFPCNSTSLNGIKSWGNA